MRPESGGMVLKVEAGVENGELLSLEEAAQFLGTSTTTLYRLIKQNELSGLKVGRQWRFRRRDLAAYLDQSQRSAEAAPLEGIQEEIDFFWSETTRRCLTPTADAVVASGARKLAYGIIGMGLAVGASDIHVEPSLQEGEESLRVRMRVDYLLRETRRLPIRLHRPLLKAIKKMAGIESSEPGLPQEGCFVLSARPPWLEAAQRFSIGVRCLPTTRGEDLTLRLCLPPRAAVRGLESTELSQEQRSQVWEWMGHRHGLIVATGLGHQKEFLYNCLLEAASPERKTIVLEETQEHELPYTASVPVNRAPGVPVPDALRAVHNHDPDVIMVERTGDSETARLIHELAFTEYLVLTAVRADHAAQAVHWFLQQQVEPLVVARTLLGIVAQWQARRICPHCKEPAQFSASDPVFTRVQQIAAEGGYEIPGGATFYHGRGCERCRSQGYLGRVDLFEVMTWSDALTDALLQGAAVEELTRVAVEQGMRTLLADGICKAVEGKTTLNEVLLAGMATI